MYRELDCCSCNMSFVFENDKEDRREEYRGGELYCDSAIYDIYTISRMRYCRNGVV